MTHEAYIGVMDGIKDFCPAIISEKQYKNVQRLIGMNKKEYKAKAPVEEYIFSGMLRCRLCGSTLNSNRIKKYNGYYKLYRCQKFKREKSCTNKYPIPETVLEKYLLSHIKEELKNYKVSYEIKKASIDNTNISCRLSKCRNKLNKLKDLYLDDLIDKDAYKAEYASLNSMIVDLEKQMDNDTEIDTDTVNAILEMDFENIYNTLQPNEKRYIWQSIIDYIEIGTNRDDITIHFR